LLEVFERRRWLVLGQPALEHAPREDADEPPVLEHRHALGVVLVEELKVLVGRQVGIRGLQRQLRDPAQRCLGWGTSRRDDLAGERLARDDADELLVFADEHRSDLWPDQQLARLLRACAPRERPRLGHHRVANPVAHG